ncbi:MAG: hypothetical protein NTZ32_06850 [Planctomycetales bacterium]|nr:hypothetical protein [Planctomycetales bacterium]
MSNSTTPRQTMIALLACVLCGVSGAAQEQPFVNESAAPAETRAVPTQPTTDKTVTDPTMPDITGTWRVKIVSPDIPTGPLVEMEIRRVPNGFQIDNPWTEDTRRISVRWWNGRGRFEGSWEADGDRHKMTLQPLADIDTLRVVVANRLNQSAKEASTTSGPEDKSIGNLSTQDWTRISKSLSTTFPEKRYGMPETLVSSEPDNRRSRTDSREVRSLPDTPAAKQLVEQLAAQESAAAAEAAAIRRLQANGQAESNKQPIVADGGTVLLGGVKRGQAEHRRKLKNLLSTAFDLKLQLEELQVKELQSRLSRLERQIGQRKELREKIIARRAGELIEGGVLKWTPDGTRATPDGTITANPVETTSTQTTPGAAAKPETVPSPKELRARLEPFAKRVASAEERVRELEGPYSRDQSGVAELKRAFEELTQARQDHLARWKAVAPTIQRLSSDYNASQIISSGLALRLETMRKMLAEGKATEEELRTVTDSYQRARETAAAQEANIRAFESEFDQWPYDVLNDPDDLISHSQPGPSTPSEHHPDVLIAWLEEVTRLKLELVQFGDLNLWFKAALRVREASDKYKKGDLIVVLNRRLFESLDQAASALKSRNSNELNSIVLSGGLAGMPRQAIFHSQGSVQFLTPEQGAQAGIRLEIRVRTEGSDVSETKYVEGICLSPDGLVVIPVSSQSLVVGEPLVAYGEIKGTARVVASDDQRGLTLIKLDSPKQKLFPWVKCRTGLPAKGQRLSIGYDRTTGSGRVEEVGQALPKPLAGNDAFVVSVGLQTPVGARLMSIENELQGMVVASVEIPTPTGNKPSHIAIPAVHLEKLVSDYRKLAASPPTTHEASATRRPRLSTSEATNDSTTERSPDSPPPYQEFAKKLATMNSSVADAEELLVVAERDAGNAVVVDTVPRARRRLDEAIRNRKAIQDEYAAVLRDLELQVESAQLEADAAKNNLERHVELSKNHAATRNELDATQLRLKQAALALERLKV